MNIILADTNILEIDGQEVEFDPIYQEEDDHDECSRYDGNGSLVTVQIPFQTREVVGFYKLDPPQTREVEEAIIEFLNGL